MKTLILHCLLLCGAITLAAQPNYSAANIPQALLKNANVVVRQYDVKFEVLDQGEAIVTEHKVLTLLNEKAEDENDRPFHYDKLVAIEDIEGAVYDSAGKLVSKLKKKDVFDRKADEHYVNDNRVKILKFSRLTFPYTIEYTVVRKYKGLMFYPDFYPQESPAESVESASLEIIMPQGLEVRVNEMNIPKNAKTGPLHWTFSDIPALDPEPYTPIKYLPLPRVLTAPTKFSLEGYDGDMSSWQSYGKFISKLNADKGELPPGTAEKLKQLTADCPDAMCKVERVYAYLQQNTRYFFIGLGIGGWQPMPAKDVDEFKYSDCKGLSNYTVSMLRAVGVPAYYTLIMAGDDEQDEQQYPNFPNPIFNHVFTCVPLGNDTIWLECTSQTESCGFLSEFTDNRLALLITPEGGVLVRTPKYDEKSNTIQRVTKLTLATDGSAQLQSNDVYRGIPQTWLAEVAEMPEENQRKALYSTLSLSDFEIKAFDIKIQKGRLPEARRNLQLAVPKFASASGKRLFVPVVALAPKISIPPTDSTRQYRIQATARSFSMEDNLTIAIPEGYSLENGIEPIAFSSSFGTYELSIKNEPGHLVIYRKLVLNNSIQPKEQFEAFVTFFKNIAKADKTKLVLAKGT